MLDRPFIALLDELRPEPDTAEFKVHRSTEIGSGCIISDVTSVLLDSDLLDADPRISISLASAATNLAFDEAMLDAAEAGIGSEVLRLWQFPEPTAVLGRGSKVDVEIDRERCELESIPVVRRCSGGASIVAGPGCLMYSIVLDMRRRPELRRLDVAHQFVMQSLADSLNRVLTDLENSNQTNGASLRSRIKVQGTCDLTIDNRKFSGNSLRVARNHLLYHGTILYAADLLQISSALKTPPRQPDYRQGRDHSGFITNISLDRGLLCQAIADAFSAQRATAGQDEIRTSQYNQVHEYLAAQTEKLAVERYCRAAWIMRH